MNIKELLKDKQLTQAGISYELYKQYKIYRTQAIISRWLSGKTSPDIEIVYYLSKILNVSCDELILSILETKNATTNLRTN